METRSSVRLSSFLAVILAVFTIAEGCSLLTKTDRELIETGGAGGTGAQGGGDGGTGGTTATAGGGGTGGACTFACCSPSDCPADETNECVQRTCVEGVCGFKPVASGVPTSAQTPGDCKEIQCDGQGATKVAVDAGDVPDDGAQCTVDSCAGGVPKNEDTPAGQACDERGGVKCDGSGACVECVTPGDCASKVCTVQGECAPAACGDGVKNGDETDVDCGGACGATCGTNAACKIDGDCIDGICSGTPLKCAAPTCTDDVKNGDETDVDCGGTCGATCGPGEGCEVDEDCVGSLCSGSFCLPSCSDGVLNNAETGVDCGGPVCDETCADGTPCAIASDCASDFCVDAVCCESACDAECVACSAATTEGGSADGTCAPAKQGTDPHNDCDLELPATCGNSSGMCDGAGTCEKHPAGTACGNIASCTNGMQTNPDSCDGAGLCVDAGIEDCGLYQCDGITCGTSCSIDTECDASAYCADTVCAAKKADGSTCEAANECASDFCVDGVCCESACAGTCVACSVAAGGPANGTCAPVASGTDPGLDCATGSSCNGAGACKKQQGQVCVVGSECLNGNCADGFCCATPCVGLCQACSNAKKGFGPDGICSSIDVGLDPDNECPGTTVCSGGGTCSLLPVAAPCTVNGECQTGFCADGVCCTAKCDAFCMACVAAKTGGTDGTCADVTPGTDPDDECPGVESCAGNLSCTEAGGGAGGTGGSGGAGGSGGEGGSGGAGGP